MADVSFEGASSACLQREGGQRTEAVMLWVLLYSLTPAPAFRHLVSVILLVVESGSYCQPFIPGFWL